MAARLKDWFRHRLWLAAELGGGVSREAVLRQLGKEPVAGPARPPACLAHIADWFRALAPLEGRSAAGLAADIEARFGIRPRPWELGLLMELVDLRQRQKEKE